MDQLVYNFSNKELSGFFKKKLSSFVPQKDNLQYIINQKQFSAFSDLTKIGEVSFQDSNELLVFSCRYKGALSERTSRRRQFEVAKKVLREDFKDGAIFVFYDHTKKFRFSFVRKNYGKKGNERYSTWKRFTYFVDPNATNKTFKDRIGNCEFANLENIQEAFSVEKLTKDFYNDLFKWYQWVLSEDVGITFPNNTTIVEDDRIKLEEQIIRLITRLLFVWFIKQKHLVPDRLFNKEEIANVLRNFDPDSTADGSYYNAILQNLFFATLNKAVEERDFAKTQNRDIKSLYRYDEMFKLSKSKILDLFKPIPFLNGGLFECLDKDDLSGNKYYLDGFSRNDTKLKGHFKHRAFIPNCVFFDESRGIIPLLERYNFTVEENVPNEVQVALDPELLGNVFENLLGAFNAETKETARKQSGSFYTPKDIVNYMVDESLISYLMIRFPKINESLIRQLFEEENLPQSLVKNHDLCEELSNVLKQIKILDPACGSGAFPMGILNRMVEVLQKLDCNNTETIYEQKLHLIEECIYGVDLQTIAAQISKLRFFISLIVEQNTMDVKMENYGVVPLPNLETKFVSANTLLGIKRKPAQQNLFENPEIEATKQELLKIRREHFYAKTAYAKKRLRERDNELRNKLSKLLQDSGDFVPEDAVQFSKWNPYDQNESSPFFDPEWMFGLTDGFDVVIGNPPYIQLQNDGGRLAKIFQNCGYKTFARSGDIYSLFYERGWQLLKPYGTLCYITSKTWMRAGYGEATRQFFAENTDPRLLIDFAGQRIFESATVNTNILLFRKAKNGKKTSACVVKDTVLNKLSDYVRQHSNYSQFSTKESWVVLSDIEQRVRSKMEEIGKPLKEWDVSIYRGILTGYNEAFIIDGKRKDQLIAQDPKSAELIRPILRGRDIKKYAYEFADLWLINTHNGIKEMAINPIDINDFPAIKKHLDGFYSQLASRSDKGQTPYNLRNCAYMDDFSKQKIVWGEISDESNFALDNNDNYFVNNKCYLLTGERLEYLVCFLNSRLSEYLFSKIGTTTGVGTAQWSKFTIEQLPIPKVSQDQEKEFTFLLSELKAGRISEAIIDRRVYEICELSSEEVDFIENQ